MYVNFKQKHYIELSNLSSASVNDSVGPYLFSMMLS
jgi:hypothetical protein